MLYDCKTNQHNKKEFNDLHIIIKSDKYIDMDIDIDNKEEFEPLIKELNHSNVIFGLGTAYFFVSLCYSKSF